MRTVTEIGGLGKRRQMPDLLGKVFKDKALEAAQH